MSIFEYDEEKHMKSEREEWRSIGREEGRKEGIEEGQDKLARLLQTLIDDGRGEELGCVLSDHEYREKLYQENNISNKV